MLDIFRDSTVGLIINAISNGKLLPYSDQDPSWKVPSNFLAGSPTSSVSESKKKQRPTEINRQRSGDLEKGLPQHSSFHESTTSLQEGNDEDRKFSPKKQEGEVSTYEVAPSPEEPSHVLVSWYDENDQDNPQ